MPKVLSDDEIFEAVMRVFIERGYAGATTRQLAEAAGVSEVTLFRKYGSKAQLVKLAILSIVDQMDFDSATQYSGDVTRDLLNIVTRYQSLSDRHGQFLSVLIPEMSRHPELVGALDRPMEIMHAIGRLLTRYQAEEVLRPAHPLHTAAALLGPLIYFAMIRGTVFDGQLPPLSLELYVNAFLDGHRR